MERAKPCSQSEVQSRRNGRRALTRHPGYCSLEHCWHCAAGLDHPKLVAFLIDEHVKACAAGKCERPRTVCVDRIGSWRIAGADNRAIDANGGEWADQCTISIEI